MSDVEITQDFLSELSSSISQLKHLQSLEIFFNQSKDCHIAFQTERSANIQDFEKFLNYKNSKSMEAKDLNCDYHGVKYTFNRATPLDDDEKCYSFILISSNDSSQPKKGMIVIADGSGIIVVSTCILDNLRQFNLDVIQALYPNE